MNLKCSVLAQVSSVSRWEPICASHLKLVNVSSWSSRGERLSSVLSCEEAALFYLQTGPFFVFHFPLL